MPHADKYNILYPFQHGFRKFRSRETQLIEFIDDVTRNSDDGKQTDVLIMDFSNWLKSLLSGRTQTAIVESEKSTYLPVDSGVPGTNSVFV